EGLSFASNCLRTAGATPRRWSNYSTFCAEPGPSQLTDTAGVQPLVTLDTDRGRALASHDSAPPQVPRHDRRAAQACRSVRAHPLACSLAARSAQGARRVGAK